MNNSTNYINEEPVSLFDPTFKYTIATCFILIAVVAAVENVLVCFAILANRHLRSYPTNLFPLSLAVTDLLTVSFAMPFDIEFVFLQGAWRHGKIMCVTFMTFYLNSGPNPILTLLVISVDRYKNLKDPFRRFRDKESMTQKKKSFDCHQHNLDLQCHVGSSSGRHGLAGKRSRAHAPRLLHISRNQTIPLYVHCIYSCAYGNHLCVSHQDVPHCTEAPQKCPWVQHRGTSKASFKRRNKVLQKTPKIA